jgi:hypothetical protein
MLKKLSTTIGLKAKRVALINCEIVMKLFYDGLILAIEPFLFPSIGVLKPQAFGLKLSST